MNVADLVEIEAIKQLKARYFRLLDTKQWDAWREVFTDDFEAEIHGPHSVMHVGSPDELVAATRKMLAESATVHHGHMPEIEITAPDRATGVWAMMDTVKLRTGFVGTGHYHEEYRKVAGQWRIHRLRLTRLLIEGLGLPGDPSK